MTEKDQRQAEYLGNRLLKRRRQLSRWARKNDIECYRLYDVDIPEIPLAVDVYGQDILMSLYERPYDKDPAEEESWLSLMKAKTSECLSIDPAKVHARFRRRQRGSSQYEALAAERQERLVREQGQSFIVNLSDYLDTGLFLDHRPLRALIRSLSRGKRVLNLFSYTGAFSVYAAAGGAEDVISVDMSSVYLEWSKRNFAANGLNAADYGFIRADATRWLADEGRREGAFDFIILDPPSFSNSKRMASDMDLARDYPDLVGRALRLLAPGGRLFFSTNARRLKFDPGLFPGFGIRDMSEESIPMDFRDRKIHRLWEIEKP